MKQANTMRVSRAVLIVLAALSWSMVYPVAGWSQEGPENTPTGSIRGYVMDAAGSPRAGVVVRLHRDRKADAPALDSLTATALDGAYAFTGLQPDSYTLRVDVSALRPAPSTRISVQPNAEAIGNIVVSDWWLGFALTAGTAIAYLVLLVVFRQHNITAPTRALLLAQIDNVCTRIPLEADTSRRPAAAVMHRQVEALRDQLNEGNSVWEYLFWSRGRELAMWSRIHEVERQLVAFLIPHPRVVERARTAEADLRADGRPQAVALANRILQTVTPAPGAPSDTGIIEPARLEQLKQQLAEALTFIYDERDKRFAGLMEWTNKAMWMVVSAILTILVVALVFGSEQLFLIGAAGGLMSRLARSLFREDVPSDYGASWTTLFLSPLLGAIAAWFGVAAIVLLVNARMLGDLFVNVSWVPPFTEATVLVGFLLGFSERMFTSLLSVVEGRAGDDLTAARGGGQSSGTPSPSSPLPPASAPADPSGALAQVTMRVAIADTNTLEAGSLRVTVDDIEHEAPPDGLLEIPLAVGIPHRIAATARQGGMAVAGELTLTPGLNDEARSFVLALAPVGAA